jgi:competence protein ComEC
MLLVYLLSVWLRRSGEAKVSLSVAALLILADDPLAIFDLSFQFSFVSVLALILTTERWGKHEGDGRLIPSDVGGWIAALRLMLLITVGTTIATIPLTLHYFHAFSWIGLLANLIAIPVAGIFIVPLGLVSVVASLFTGSFPWIGWHQQVGAGFFNLLDFFAHLPGAGMKFSSPPLWGVTLFYGGMAWLWVRRAPGWTFALATALLLSMSLLRDAPDALRITFLDVGQGDATLIEFPEGPVVLVDGGEGGDFNVGAIAVSPYLWQRGIRRIDDVIGSHPQNDHMGGLGYVVRSFDVGRFWTNGTESKALFYRLLQREMHEKGLIERVAHDALPPLEVGACRLHFLNRLQPAAKRLNDRSVVFRLHCPAKSDFSLLMTGDVEQKGQRALLQRASALQSVLLKVPHHGSRGAIDEDFLAAVSPSVAVLSAGRRNRYDHPHAETISAYARQRIALYQTPKQGAIVVEVTPKGMAVHMPADARPRPVAWHLPILPQEWENLKRVFAKNFGQEVYVF